VLIPKPGGGERPSGIPTIRDRVAQQRDEKGRPRYSGGKGSKRRHARRGGVISPLLANITINRLLEVFAASGLERALVDPAQCSLCHLAGRVIEKTRFRLRQIKAIRGAHMTEEKKSDGQWRPIQEMDPDTTYRFRVPADRLISEITPNSDIFVLAHFGVPRIERSNWHLHISGMVARPAVLAFEDILRFRKFEIQSFLNCAGFPANPKIATRNASNAVWAGADLAEVLDSVGVHSNASLIWSYGPDHGAYQNWRADCYVKDLPIERIRSGKVLLVYEVNGEPLSHAHGYPVRLFIPGFYGTNSVKWLCRIEASDRRAPGIFTTELYNDPVPFDSMEASRRTAPLWEVPPEALIVSPAANATVSIGPIHVWGWSWGTRRIKFVEISVDKGRTWHRVEAGSRIQNSWQRFHFIWNQETPGEFSIAARATDLDDKTQPDANARNSVHKINIVVL